MLSPVKSEFSLSFLVLQDREPLHERNEAGRKRKGPSPVKPAAKRSVSRTRGAQPSARAAPASTAAAASAAPATGPGVSLLEQLGLQQNKLRDKPITPGHVVMPPIMYHPRG